MTIAYNSAYVQTETLNFTFARQAVIVYFAADMSALTVRKFWSMFYPLMVHTSACPQVRILHAAATAPCSGTSILHVSTVTFLRTALKPQHRPRTSVHHWKANEK